MGMAMDKPDRAATDASQDPDTRLETDLQADASLREGPVPPGRLVFITIALIVVVAVVWWALTR